MFNTVMQRVFSKNCAAGKFERCYAFFAIPVSIYYYWESILPTRLCTVFIIKMATVACLLK
jgi:hypothetical protein